MVSEFVKTTIIPNAWRYIFVLLACFTFAFFKTCTGPKWYRAEATLVFKNRSDVESLRKKLFSQNPLPIFFDTKPIEDAYDYRILLYSKNMVKRVLGDDFEEIYAEGDYDGTIDFYNKFMALLGYDYDNIQKVVHLSYTYKDPEKAARFCNLYAKGLEDFMIDQVEKTHVSKILRQRLVQARKEADKQTEEVNRIAEVFNVPDLFNGPKEWQKTYLDALMRSEKAKLELKTVLAALGQLKENDRKRDLLSQSGTPPDTNVIKELAISALRTRYAMTSAALDVLGEAYPQSSAEYEKFKRENTALRQYLDKQYKFGTEVESATLLQAVNKLMVIDYLNAARADMLYSRFEKLPELEADVRPYIRKESAASGVANTLEKWANIIEIGESYGVDPIKILDDAIPPDRPLMLIWGLLMRLVPVALFLSTLWFGLLRLMAVEARGISAISNTGEE